jgi:hypothetical protein
LLLLEGTLAAQHGRLVPKLSIRRRSASAKPLDAPYCIEINDKQIFRRVAA